MALVLVLTPKSKNQVAMFEVRNPVEEGVNHGSHDEIDKLVLFLYYHGNPHFKLLTLL